MMDSIFIPTLFAAYVASCFLMFGDLHNEAKLACAGEREPARCVAGSDVGAVLFSPIGPIYWAAKLAIYITNDSPKD